MATFSDLSARNRLFMATYRFRRLAPVPLGPARPLAESRVALVSTGAFHLRDQIPFDVKRKGGDCSFREIPSDADVRSLLMAHKSDAFDQSGVLLDRNLGFPLDRLREMEAGGEVGSLNHRHISFMGSITAPGRLLAETGPAAAELLAGDRVDAAVLTPL